MDLHGVQRRVCLLKVSVDAAQTAECVSSCNRINLPTVRLLTSLDSISLTTTLLFDANKGQLVERLRT